MSALKNRMKNSIQIGIVAGVLVAFILVIGTVIMGQSANKDTEYAVHTVSNLYLNELAGRREQVVETNLTNRIDDMQTAIDLITDDDISSMEHLQAYQARMKKLYRLEKFAFVDDAGIIYTSKGIQHNIEDYDFDYKTISEPEISILNLKTVEKKLIIAVPVKKQAFDNVSLVVCFMEIDMKEMLQGVSMKSETTDTTFCNLYTNDGIALTNMVLGGLASEDNLLEAMKNAHFDEGYGYQKFISEFKNGVSGEVTFTYNERKETLTYVPVKGTNWLLTYLIREQLIADEISSMSNGIMIRSVVQSVLIAIVIMIVFMIILAQQRNNAKLSLEKESADIEARVRQHELEKQLELQEKLLEEEKSRVQQNKMITALSSDYRSVYYLELDSDKGVCYQEHSDIENGFKVGEQFKYMESVTAYADAYITDNYREEFMRFIQPDNIREGLKSSRVISYRYMIRRHGKESYEMVRFAGVRHPVDRDDGIVHAVSACFTDVDEETRQSIAQSETLSEALSAAEQANIAKTVFLSNMSHEIRTPMNAIIGLDNIALNDPEISMKTRDYLTKIGDSAEHLLNLINDILDMSRIESGSMIVKNEEFSFSKLIEYINTMISGQCEEKGLDYQCHIKGSIDDYYVGDNMKLRQVLINIIGNAVKFTPTGGYVRMDIERTAKFDNKSTLKFIISDNGIGISEEFMPNLFDAFSQENITSTGSKYGSSGLGLAITKNIVEMMNGNISVESTKGEGSTFTVVVTLMDSDRHGDEEDYDIKPHEMSVLIVDDDHVACEHAKLVLEKTGVASEIAHSGPEAIEMVKLRHARREPYNLILVDWKMPEMDGVETTKRIREIVGNKSAIIILTAYKWDDILDEAVRAGVDSFIAKPLFAANVVEEFKDAMSRKGVVKKAGNRPEVDLSDKKVLLAEDMEINAEIMKMVLAMRGIEADIAGNGRIAVDTFTSHPEGYYSAILMDIRMPEMDGLEATRIIRNLDRSDAKSIPIIALTANAFDEDVQRSLQAGLNAHLTKPVKPEALFDTLESFMLC